MPGGTEKTGRDDRRRQQDGRNNGRQRRDLGKIPRSQAYMVDGMKTDGTIFVILSVLMVMKGNEQHQEKEAGGDAESRRAMPSARDMQSDIRFPTFQGVAS